MLQWLTAKLHTWEGIVGSLATSIVTIWAALKLIPKLWDKLISLVQAVKMIVNVEIHLVAILKEMREGFLRLDRGQHNMIQTRRCIMDADERVAFFECDSHGKCVWTNKLWRQLTGLDSDEARGSGWERGIAENDRHRVLSDWQASLDHQRIYEDVVTYCDRLGHLTKVRVTANPIRDDQGNILSWHGHAIRERNNGSHD